MATNVFIGWWDRKKLHTGSLLDSIDSISCSWGLILRCMVSEHPGDPESQYNPSHYLPEVGSKLLESGNHMLQPPRYLRPQAWASMLSQNSYFRASLVMKTSKGRAFLLRFLLVVALFKINHRSIRHKSSTDEKLRSDPFPVNRGWRIQCEPWFPLVFSYCPQPNRTYLA